MLTGIVFDIIFLPVSIWRACYDSLLGLLLVDFELYHIVLHANHVHVRFFPYTFNSVIPTFLIVDGSLEFTDWSRKLDCITAMFTLPSTALYN